jgi:hypothetical protein
MLMQAEKGDILLRLERIENGQNIAEEGKL